MRRVLEGSLAAVLLALIISAPLAAAPALPVFKIVALTSPVARGSTAKLILQTSPRVACMLLVRYQSGPTTTSLTLPQKADKRGLVSWTWRVDSKARPGSWPLIIHCTDEERGQLAWGRMETSFVVR